MLDAGRTRSKPRGQAFEILHHRWRVGGRLAQLVDTIRQLDTHGVGRISARPVWTRHSNLRKLASLVLLIAAGVVAVRPRAEFVPRLDEGSLAVQIVRLPSVSLEESVRGATRFEQVMREFPEVLSVVSKTGRAEIATDPMGVELSDCIVQLRPQAEWTTAPTREQLVQKISERLAEVLPDLGFSFSQPIELRMAELISGSRSDVAITIYGDDLAALERLSLDVQASVRGARSIGCTC